MNTEPIELRRILGRRDVLALAFGAMVGWGWIVLSGTMIVRAGSLGSALAFVAGAVMVLLVGLTYAELTSALSRAGGEIGFTYAGLGPSASYVCGWTLVLAYLSVCAFEAASMPAVVGYLLPGLESGYLYTIAGWDVHASGVALGMAGALGIGAINYLGIRLASFVQWAATLSLLAVGVAFFLPGNVAGDPANLSPAFTDLAGFFGVVIMTPFLFLGFDVIPQVAEEIDIPFRAVGRLILVSILIALVWYALVQWTVGLHLAREAIAIEGVLAPPQAMSLIYGSEWGGRILVAGGVLGILTSWNAFVIGATRLLFAMGRAGMLPAVFGRLHPRYESPVAALVLVTLLSALAPFFGRQALVWCVDAGGLAAVVSYLLVTVSFLSMRKRYPDLDRPYRAPLARVLGPVAVAVTVLFVTLYLPGSPSALVWPYEWAIVVFWIGLGAVLAVGARRRAQALGRAGQAERILGEYAAELQRASDPGR